MKTRHTLLLFGLAVVLGLALAGRSVAQEGDEHADHDHNHAQTYEGKPAYYLAEHGDFGIGFEDGQLALHVSHFIA